MEGKNEIKQDVFCMAIRFAAVFAGRADGRNILL